MIKGNGLGSELGARRTKVDLLYRTKKSVMVWGRTAKECRDQALKGFGSDAGSTPLELVGGVVHWDGEVETKPAVIRPFDIDLDRIG